MSNLYRISVLTPSFNSKAYIEQAIQSVLDQNYPEFEHIIMDGGSTDGTLEVLKQYRHLIWRSEKDRGQSHALNKAVELSKGEIIVVLNADDFFEPEAFKTVNSIYSFSKSINFLVGGCNLLGENDKLLKSQDPIKCDLSLFGLLHWWWGYNHPLNPSCYFYRKEVQTVCGPFNEDNHDTMDYEFLLNCACKYNFEKTSNILGNYRYLPGTKTHKNNEKGNLNLPLSYSIHYWKYLPVLKQLKILVDYLDVTKIKPLLYKLKLIDDKRYYSFVRE